MNDRQHPYAWRASSAGSDGRGFAAGTLRWVLASIAMGLPAAAVLAGNTILGSKHDLSVQGGGTVKATSESEVCLFCHTPHRAIDVQPGVYAGPLWNHVLGTQPYTPYGSTTAKASIDQPTGASKMCLSCHDGTVALGMIGSQTNTIEMAGGVTAMPAGRSNLGTDLSDDHPISFKYDTVLVTANGELKDPATLTGKVRLDGRSELQCTSCHDPHNNQYGKFMVMENTASALCVTCHEKNYWLNSSHKTSIAQWNGAGQNPWPNTTNTTVAANACESCHATHGAKTKSRLLVFDTEEGNCSSCHNGNVAAKNIMGEFTKPSIHPIADHADYHDAAEDLKDLSGAKRHVECADCHNPHASKLSSATAPNASGALAGVAGINSGGAVVDPITKEYELCYRCHSDSGNRGPARVPRVTVETDTQKEFAPGNQSYHPVEVARNNPDVPSLKSPWLTTSVMYCTDCHGNNTANGPKGPHGSIYVPILKLNLTTTDFGTESASAYALCYDCHDRTSLMTESSSFKYHLKHVREKQTACTTCHDSHGVVGTKHLINFNTAYVTPSSGGQLKFVDNGTYRGACYLTCHGQDHNPKTYAP